jgi:hypothetical protein
MRSKEQIWKDLKYELWLQHIDDPFLDITIDERDVIVGVTFNSAIVHPNELSLLVAAIGRVNWVNLQIRRNEQKIYEGQDRP